jgi:hypothetical protein
MSRKNCLRHRRRPADDLRSGIRFLPWFGHVADYRQHNGYWLPFRAEVGWKIDGERIVFWEGRLTEWWTVPQF